MKQLNTHLLIVGSIALILTACGNKASDKKAGDNTGDTSKIIAKPPAETPEKGIKFIIKNKGMDSMDIPHAEVFLYVDGTETFVKAVNGCSDIPKESYAQHDIPKDAVAACGGWWAGAGDYFYVMLRNEKPIVFAGWQDEQQEDKGFHWEEVKFK